MLTEALIFAVAYFLGGGKLPGKKSAPSPAAPVGPAPSKPSQVPWPGGEGQATTLEEKELAIQRAKLKRDAAAAHARVHPGDDAAHRDIAQKEKERKAALDMMQQDIERSKASPKT